jgi:hypothetical protein
MNTVIEKLKKVADTQVETEDARPTIRRVDIESTNKDTTQGTSYASALR